MKKGILTLDYLQKGVRTMKKFFLLWLVCGVFLPLSAQILVEESNGRILSCRKIAVEKDGSILFQLPETGEVWHRLPAEKCLKITLPKPGAIQDCDALFAAGKFRESAAAFAREGKKNIYPTFYAYCLLYEILSLEKAGRKKEALDRIRQKLPQFHEREKKAASYGELLFHAVRLLREGKEQEEALKLLSDMGKYAWGSFLPALFILKGDLLQELKREKESVSAYFQAVLFFPESPRHLEALEKLHKVLTALNDPRAEKFGHILRQKKPRNPLKK